MQERPVSQDTRVMLARRVSLDSQVSPVMMECLVHQVRSARLAIAAIKARPAHQASFSRCQCQVRPTIIQKTDY